MKNQHFNIIHINLGFHMVKYVHCYIIIQPSTELHYDCKQ
jgi:hypothetical protein